MSGYKAILLLLSVIAAVLGVQNTTIIPSPSTVSTSLPPMTSTTLKTSTMIINSSSIQSSAMHSSAMSSSLIINSTAISPSSPMMSSTVSSNSSSPMTTHIQPSSSAVPTTPPPTTTATPTPDYNVNVKVKDHKTNNTCMWLEATIVISYQYMYNNSMKKESIHVVQEDLDVSRYNCSSFKNPGDTSLIELEQSNYKLLFEFTSDKDVWFVSQIGVSIDVDDENRDLKGVLKLNKSSPANSNGHLSGKKSDAYSCDDPQTLDLDTDNKTTAISVDLKKFYVQPFENDGKKTTKTSRCPSAEKPTKSSSIVPIAVGCALAGLIVIVLIAYLIGRRKSDAKGYQQV